MRKLFSVFFFFFLLLLLIFSIGWANRTTLFCHFLSHQLQVPVHLDTLQVSLQQVSASKLLIENPPHSQTSTAFSSETVILNGTLEEVLGSTLTIEEIRLKNIFVGIEFYDPDKQRTNWTQLLTISRPSDPHSKNYLIRKLILENLTVEVIQANGDRKQYPTIERIELHQINHESGFPIEEIEKAIFKLMLQDLFKQLDLEQLLNILPAGILPAPLPQGGLLKPLPGLLFK